MDDEVAPPSPPPQAVKSVETVAIVIILEVMIISPDTYFLWVKLHRTEQVHPDV